MKSLFLFSSLPLLVTAACADMGLDEPTDRGPVGGKGDVIGAELVSVAVRSGGFCPVIGACSSRTEITAGGTIEHASKGRERAGFVDPELLADIAALATDPDVISILAGSPGNCGAVPIDTFTSMTVTIEGVAFENGILGCEDDEPKLVDLQRLINDAFDAALGDVERFIRFDDGGGHTTWTVERDGFGGYGLVRGARGGDLLTPTQYTVIDRRLDCDFAKTAVTCSVDDRPVDGALSVYVFEANGESYDLGVSRTYHDWQVGDTVTVEEDLDAGLRRNSL